MNDLLIVGAGPTGLTAAVGLARRGIIARVIDKKPGVSRLSRAVGINWRTLHLFDESGLSAKLVERGVKVREALFFIGDKEAFRLNLGFAPRPYDFLLALPQDVTEQVLIDELESLGGRVEFGVEAVSMHVLEAGATLRLKHLADEREEVAEFGSVLGADGMRSRIRQWAGIGFGGIELPERWSIVDFDAKSWPHSSRLCLFVYDGGRVCLVVPIGRHRFRGVTDRPDGIKGLPPDLEIGEIRREGSFQISVKQAETYQKDRVFLAGDAAHAHSPVGGRGMNLGIADAACFARLYGMGGLKQYTKLRHPVGRRVIRMTETARKFMTTAWPGKSSVLGYLIPALLSVPQLHRYVVRNALDFPGRVNVGSNRDRRH